MSFPWKVPADEEYSKHPKLKKEDVQAIQEWIKSTDYLPKIDDEMVCNFLYACFYNVEQAKKTIENFYTYKNTMPDFFDNWDPSIKEIQDAINNVLIASPLPETDNDGHRVIVCKLNDTNTELFNYPACVKWILMSCVYSLWARGIQKGYVIVYDATGFTMSHLLKCSLTNVRNYINYGKNASPIRVRKIVFINTSPVVKRLMTLVKPFLSKEIIEMMSFHTDFESFFANVPKTGVPEDYGGEAPAMIDIHKECVRTIMEHKEWIVAEGKVRADDTKKGGKSKKDKLDGSFKRLELD
uniref:CRAL-TRIO domain-containing protein n=1 Tax=Riptortus pedestris TaxID=329032 RepID=R4WPA8_RIPPE|nr:conserved hypothetical protein [Riptortus pedestris]